MVYRPSHPEPHRMGSFLNSGPFPVRCGGGSWSGCWGAGRPSRIPRSSLSGSATRCRSSAGRCWWSRACPGAGSGRAVQSGCGWRIPGGIEPGGAACPGHRFCCTLTTPRCPSWLRKERATGTGHFSQQEEGRSLSLHRPAETSWVTRLPGTVSQSA